MKNTFFTKNNSTGRCRFSRISYFKPIFILCITIYAPLTLAAESCISTTGGQGMFAIVAHGKSTPIYLSSQDYTGVLKVSEHLQSDIERVTHIKPKIIMDELPVANDLIIVGTIGRSPVIDKLIQENKINAKNVDGRWDTYALQTVDNPLPTVNRALVIFGSNKRGTIYGMYDLASRIGVSPWYWWADVPVQKKKEIYFKPGYYSPGEPKVKYRGIFINDEAPALRNWAEEKFGGFNSKFYEKVFELILRHKGNYLWPAMWCPAAFSEDDLENPRLADELGVIISTSHHEPMMRSHHEWTRFNGGEWNYKTNTQNLRKFWRGGIERMDHYESVVTVGMRGDGDKALAQETAIHLLNKIIADQRKIIVDVTGKPAEETPQVWAVYKEVQDYYDKGMRVDDDILILFCDDNWGNLRILPKKQDLNHKGGYGIYYHFDYVGGPVSYRWLNVTQIERVWEQMNIAYEYGVHDLWLVNVGDIKPMELPISFFLDFAWNPEMIDASDLPDYYIRWARQQFGDQYANEIAEILALYTKYNARRTPEMLAPDTYSLKNYREADKVVDAYIQLLEKTRMIYKKLPESYASAFYQLVLFPVQMSCNMNEMVLAASKNKRYGEQGRASTKYYAEKVKELFWKDAEITRYFHEKLENGKWNHMMSQTHIGYSSWNHPRRNKMPAVSYIQTRKPAELGFEIEHGAEPDWGGFSPENDLLFSKSFSNFDPVNDQNYYIELFNLGEEPLSYTITPKDKWINLSAQKGVIQFDEKIVVSIHWQKAPKGKAAGQIEIAGAGKKYLVRVPINNNLPGAAGFVENNGVVSIEAANYTNAVNSTDIRWTVIPNLGRTHSSLTAEPANAERQAPGENTPRLEYLFTLFKDSELKIDTHLSPTLNFKKNEGLMYAIAIDDEEPQIINLHEGEILPDWEYPEWWNNSVTDHIRIKRSIHKKFIKGIHTLKVWMVDPGVVFQKFVIDAGGLRASYLGPPESIYVEPSLRPMLNTTED